MLSKLVMRIEYEQRNIEKGICDCPPEDYAKFREMVGKRNGLRQVLDIINELTKEDDVID